MTWLSRLKETELLANAHSALLQGVLEGLIDGVLILTVEGEWVYGNYYAHRVCEQLNQSQGNTHTRSEDVTTSPRQVPASSYHKVPAEIWRVCAALIESRDLYPNLNLVIESEISLSKATKFRVRVRWLILDDTKRPYLVVLLEDCLESLQSQALAEVQKYYLTPRQAEVWILHRIGYSYREIADQLYISLDTVKKHIKDIHAKQKKALANNG